MQGLDAKVEAVCSLLLGAGADPNALDAEGCPPLYFAAQVGSCCSYVRCKRVLDVWRPPADGGVCGSGSVGAVSARAGHTRNTQLFPASVSSHTGQK